MRSIVPTTPLVNEYDEIREEVTRLDGWQLAGQRSGRIVGLLRSARSRSGCEGVTPLTLVEETRHKSNRKSK